jgi:hypothetical protein
MTREIKLLIITLITVSFISCQYLDGRYSAKQAKAHNVFASVVYDKVVAYNYDGEDGSEIITGNGQLAKKIKQQIELNQSQIVKITNVLCDKVTYGGAMAKCFTPHFGLVFYQANQPTAFVSICLHCNSLISSREIPNAVGGFSDEGVKQIVDFEKELNFSR